MKLTETKPYLESYGELEEQFFTIQDHGMIFDILRNKMYSNPILAICREISCNARDAHREVGNLDPIVIHLPNSIEPYYKIRDFGPGISPDRMANIFIKYAASTKRSDNLQTGGFGLGAKTPFSYSDSFSIITIVDGVRYNYNCIIDETKVGKIMLANQSFTKEKNGTEIIIPVLPKNFNEFNIYTEQACRHWSVKPIIKGGLIEWKNLNLIFKGDNWGIASSGDYGNNDIKIIVDGIEYLISVNTLRNYVDTKLIDVAYGIFIMYFGVGELSLSANRESIYLDEKTQNVIRNRLDQIKNSIKDQVMQKIDECDNLWNANVFYNKELRKAFHNIDFLGVLTWKDIPLTKSFINFETKVFTFTKNHVLKNNKINSNKISKSISSYVSFEDNAVIYLNDLMINDHVLNSKHVKKAFNDNPVLKIINVITPNDKITKDYLDNKFHFDKMNVKYLSDITKATNHIQTSNTQRLLLFKFDEKSAAFRQISYSSIDEDCAKTKVLCTLHRDNSGTRALILKDKPFFNLSFINTLINKFTDISFYGLDDGVHLDRIKKDFSNFIDIQQFIKNNFSCNSSIDYIKIKYILTHNHHTNHRFAHIVDKIKPMIFNKDSVFIKMIENQLFIKSISNNDIHNLNMYELVNEKITTDQLESFARDNPSSDIVKINLLFNKQYPMFKYISEYNYLNSLEDIANYVNLVDKENSNVKCQINLEHTQLQITI